MGVFITKSGKVFRTVPKQRVRVRQQKPDTLSPEELRQLRAAPPRTAWMFMCGVPEWEAGGRKPKGGG